MNGVAGDCDGGGMVLSPFRFGVAAVVNDGEPELVGEM